MSNIHATVTEIPVGYSPQTELAFGIHALQYIHLMRQSNPKFMLKLRMQSMLAREFFYPAYSEFMKVVPFYRPRDFRMPAQFPLESYEGAIDRIRLYFGGVDARLTFPNDHQGLSCLRLHEDREREFRGSGILIFKEASGKEERTLLTQDDFWLLFCRHYGKASPILFPQDSYLSTVYMDYPVLPVYSSDHPSTDPWFWVQKILLSRLVIGNEGFYTHLAGWLGVPTLMVTTKSRPFTKLGPLPFRSSRFATYTSETESLSLPGVIHAIDELERNQLSEL